MYRIVIFQEGQPPVRLYSDEELTDEVKSSFPLLFTSAKIVSITTKMKNEEDLVILRPSKVVALRVSKVENDNFSLEDLPEEFLSKKSENDGIIEDIEVVEEEDSKSKAKEKKESEEVDIITD